MLTKCLYLNFVERRVWRKVRGCENLGIMIIKNHLKQKMRLNLMQHFSALNNRVVKNILICRFFSDKIFVLSSNCFTRDLAILR